MEEPAIPWSRVAAFVRQYTHDVRNSLHGLDLETALLHDLVAGAGQEAVDGANRVHSHVRSMARHLRNVSALFQDPDPMLAPLPASSLLRIWRENHAALAQPPNVTWNDDLTDQNVAADVAMMATVFRELLTNAVNYSRGAQLTIHAGPRDGDVVFEMREPKNAPVDTAAWGRPFESTQRARYGLGLWTARRLMTACGVTLEQRYLPDDRCLASKLTLGIVPPR